MLAIVLVCLSVVATATHAQEEAPKVSVRFCSIRDLPQKEYYLVSESFQTPVTVSSWFLSDAIKVPANVPLYLCDKKPDSENGDTLLTHAVAKLTLSGSHLRMIGLVMPNPSAGKKGVLPMLVMTINGAVDKFRGGERMVFNLSKLPLAIKCGNSKAVLIKGAGRGVVKIPAGTKDGLFIPVVGQFQVNNKWRKFMSSRWLTNDKVRTLMFVYPEPATKSLRFHGVEESLTVLKKN